ncbi:MAG: hypothetical protein ACHQ4H_16340, partial [Ktedonobacterales bacterium]
MQHAAATADATVKAETAAFTGVQNGSQISITFSELGVSATLTGTLNGSTLALNVPQQNGYVATEVFQAASVANYNDAISQLRQRV